MNDFNEKNEAVPGKNVTVLFLLADGFEETEAIAPIDILRRAGACVKTVGVTGKYVTGAHGIRLQADCSYTEIKSEKIDCLVLPGGMPGTNNLDRSPVTDEAIEKTLQCGGRLAAICAAPLILGKRGLLSGKKATCYPSFERYLTGAEYTQRAVVTDGNVTTSRGAGTAIDFALTLVSLLFSEEKAEEIRNEILYRTTPEN